MGGDMSDGAKIAITLIILGVLISIVFTILSFTRNATNQGVSAVENSMNAMQLSRFDDYDQKIISGTQVNSALKLFEGQPIALVVRTRAQLSASANTGHNYGALLAGTNTTTFITPAMVKGAGNSWYTVDIALSASNTITYNTNYLNTTISGNPQFIRTTAKFTAELVKDSTDSIVGICFTQN